MLQGDVTEAVRALKQEDGRDPLLVGGGKRIFPDDGGRRPLRLLDSQVTTTAAMLATYAAAET